MLGMHIVKLQRLIPSKKTVYPLVRRRGVEKRVVEVFWQPGPAMPPPLAVWPAQFRTPLRPRRRDRRKTGRLRLGCVFQGMVTRNFQIGHRVGAKATAHGIVRILRAAPRMGIVQRHCLHGRSGAGTVPAKQGGVPDAVANHVERLGSVTHLHAHLIRDASRGRRAVGRAHGHELAERLVRHPVGRIRDSMRRIAVGGDIATPGHRPIRPWNWHISLP